MNNIIDWVEKAALENIRFHLKNADDIAKEATTTLTIFLAGLAAALAHGVKGLEKEVLTSTTYASLILSVYIAVLAAMLIYKCMRIAPIPAPTNEPKNLYQKNMALDEIKEEELENLQIRINQAVERNDFAGSWLNRMRIAATLSPFIWALAFYYCL